MYLDFSRDPCNAWDRRPRLIADHNNPLRAKLKPVRVKERADVRRSVGESSRGDQGKPRAASTSTNRRGRAAVEGEGFRGESEDAATTQLLRGELKAAAQVTDINERVR